jgi:thiopeptide-type bacteriocin biosynthesis protein
MTDNETRRSRSGKRGLYEALDGFCVRAPILPIVSTAEESQKSFDKQLNVTDAVLRYALTIASPSLITAFERARATGDEKELGEVYGKLLRYVIRMRSRPTPFGLFAGVAMGRWGPETDLTLNGIDRIRIRPDMEWLATLVRQLEKRAAIRRNLLWVANSACFGTAGRVYLEERRAWDDQPGASLRATPAVLRALEGARAPISYSALVELLAASNDVKDRDHCEELLDRLWQEALLYTDLMPAPTTTEPLQHVIRKLQPIPQARTVCLRLAVLDEAIRCCEIAPPEKALELHQYAAAQAKLIANVGPPNPLQTDCSVALIGQHINQEVAHRAAKAAEVLLRLGGSPHGPTRIVQYRQKFLMRYGHHREVPLLELMSPDWGLGPLGEIKTSSAIGAADTQTRMRRSEAIQDLALRALRDRRRCVVIDEAMLARLEHKQFDVDRAPASLDLHISIIASDPKSIDEGRFKIALAPTLGIIGAGRYSGRFADLLGPDLERLRRDAANREQSMSSARIVELSYLPTTLRAVNVGISPAIREYQSCYGTVSSDDGKFVPLREIMVSVLEDHFVLRWPRGKCFVRFCAAHVIATNRAPQVVQFLLEASQDGVAQLAPFDWGACSTYPVLPRLEHQGIILCPARWRIEAPVHPRHPSEKDIEKHISAWRADWGVPAQVYLSAGDNRLLLDLDDPEHLNELTMEVGKLKPTESCYVEEALPGIDHAWVPGDNGTFLTDVIVSLTKNSSEPPKTIAAAAQFEPPSRAQRLKVPGGDWVYLKIYVPTAAQDELLRGPLRKLCSDIAGCSQLYKWFFIRYADPEPHLRLRFHGAKEWLNREWQPALLEWARSLLERGLCDQLTLDTYAREIERYGGLASIDCAETLFHLDSVSVLQLLDYAATDRLGFDVTALAVATLDDLYSTLAPSAEAAVRWLNRAAGESRKVVGEQFREKKASLFEYAGERCSSQPSLAGILQERRNKIERAGYELRRLEESSALCLSMEDLCRSLAHMHLNRLFAIGQFDEGRLLGLLARTKQSLTHRELVTDAVNHPTTGTS